MNGRVVGTILVWIAVSHGSAQQTAVRDIAVYSCASADSLFGPMKHKGSVLVFHSPDSTTFQIHESGAMRLSARLNRVGNQPERWPVPDLTVAIEGTLGERILAERPRRPMVAMILDDTTRLFFGPGLVGNYFGSKARTLAPVLVIITPLDALRLAKAGKAAVVIDSTVQQLPSEDLRVFELFYRFATCDTIRYH